MSKVKKKKKEKKRWAGFQYNFSITLPKGDIIIALFNMNNNNITHFPDIEPVKNTIIFVLCFKYSK